MTSAVGPAPLVRTVSILGVPLARVSAAKAVALVDRMIALRKPRFFVIADAEYLRTTCIDAARFEEIHQRATFVLAGQRRLVFYSILKGRPLPGTVRRVAMFRLLCRRAAEAGHRVFLVSGGKGVATRAAEKLVKRHPKLNIVGVEETPQRFLHGTEELELIARIRQSAPDLLLVGTGQPRGEIWLESHLENLGVPACVRVGPEAFAYAVGRPLDGAPQWLESAGLGWAWRALRWPLLLPGRFLGAGWFIFRAAIHDVLHPFRELKSI